MSYNHLHSYMSPLTVSSDMLDGRFSFSTISNSISEYFYQKFGHQYNLSYDEIEKLTGSAAIIPHNIYHKIDDPKNTNNENEFLIDVYCGILDFAIDLEQYRNIHIHEQINLFLSVSDILKIQNWNEDLIPVLQKHPKIFSKINNVLSSFLMESELKFDHSFILLDINTDLDDYKILKPLQHTLINTYLTCINDSKKSAISLKKSLNPDKNYHHLIEPLSTFFNFDCSTLINDRHRINDNEIRVHFELPLGINLTFSKFLEKLQKFVSLLNSFNFEQNYLFPSQKFLHGSKISLLSPFGNNEFSPLEIQFILKVEHENPSIAFALSEELSTCFFDFTRLSLDKHEITPDGFIIYTQPNKKSRNSIIISDTLYYQTSLLYFLHEERCQSIRTLMLHHTLSVNNKDDAKSHTKVKI